MAEAVKPDKAAQDKFLTAALKKFKLGNEATTANRVHQLDDVKFAAGSPDNHWQWPEKVYQSRTTDPNGARPCLTNNLLPQHIRLVTNEQRQNRPSVKVLPVDDKGDPEVAEVFNGIIRHIEANSDADIAYDTACDGQVTHGEGFIRVLTEYADEMSFEQEILIRSVRNSFSVTMDPDGLRKDGTGRYIEWCFITDKVHKDAFDARFPDAENTNWKELGVGDDTAAWMDGDYVVIAEHFYYKDTKKKLYLFADGQAMLEGDPLNRMALEQPIKTRTTTIRKIMWCKMSGLEVLEEREWAGKYIPVVRIVGNEYDIEGKIICSGIVRNAKDAQRMSNYWDSQETEVLALAPKQPWLGAVGQFGTMGEQFNNANVVNYSRLEYDPIEVNGIVLPPPQRSGAQLPPTGIINAKLGARDTLQATVGQYNPSLGAEAKEKSGKAIVARQQQADIGTYHFVDNLARGIRHLGRILVDLAPKIYDTKRVARMMGEDGEVKHAEIDPEQQESVVKVKDEQGAIKKIYNLNVGRFDVTTISGPNYTTKRREAVEAMAQLVQGNPELWKVIGDLLIKNMDWPGADEMAKRMKRAMPPEITADDTEEASPELQQAMQVIEQLKQQLGSMEQVIQQIQDGAEAQKLAIQKYDAITKRMEADSKDKERQFNATVEYVDRTVVDDTQLLAPGGAQAQTETING